MQADFLGVLDSHRQLLASLETNENLALLYSPVIFSRKMGEKLVAKDMQNILELYRHIEEIVFYHQLKEVFSTQRQDAKDGLLLDEDHIDT